MTDFWQNKIIPILTHPVTALHGVLFLALNIGFLKVFTTLIAERQREFESDLRVIASHMSLVIFVVALIAGAMAVVYSIFGTQRPEKADDEDMQARMKRWLTDPFKLLDIGIYAVAYLGLIATLLVMIEVRGFGPVTVWSWWAQQMFFMLTGVLVLILVRALANSLAMTAPSGAADDDEEESKEDSDDEEKAEDSGSDGPGFADRWLAHVGTWELQARYGLIALGYLGALFVLLDMWNWRDFPANALWWNYFREMAIVLGAIGVVILLRRVIEVATHTETVDPEDDSVSMVNQVIAKIHDPGKASLMVLVAMAFTAGSFALMNIWLARNADVLDFWAEVMWSLHLAVPAIAFPLILWSLWQVLTSENARASKSFLYDPYRQLTVVIYLVAYLGMIDFVFHGWLFRDLPPAREWQIVGEDLFDVVARVSVFVALRAVVAAVIMGRNPAVEESTDSSSDAEAEAEPA